MQVLLNTDPNVDGGRQMAAHLKQVVLGALGRFGEQVTRVEAHLSDANSQAKAGPSDIHCTLEARLRGRDPVVVKDHAGSAHQAINGALAKLERVIGSTLDKRHDPRRSEAPSADAAPGRPGDIAD